jgi:hypothetical protein
MTQNYSFSRDLKEAQAMAESLGEYVRGKQLYAVTAGGRFAGMPSLTAGALLLRLRRLHLLRVELDDKEVKTLDKTIDLYEKVRTDWAYHYEQKILQEAHSRLDAMKTFFYECADNIRQCLGIYKPELMRRTIVQEILFEMVDMNIEDDDLIKKKEAIDEKVRKYVEPTGFQWDEVLKRAYPIEDFWWLYHSPPDLP